MPNPYGRHGKKGWERRQEKSTPPAETDSRKRKRQPTRDTFSDNEEVVPLMRTSRASGGSRAPRTSQTRIKSKDINISMTWLTRTAVNDVEETMEQGLEEEPVDIDSICDRLVNIYRNIGEENHDDIPPSDMIAEYIEANLMTKMLHIEPETFDERISNDFILAPFLDIPGFMEDVKTRMKETSQKEILKRNEILKRKETPGVSTNMTPKNKKLKLTTVDKHTDPVNGIPLRSASVSKTVQTSMRSSTPGIIHVNSATQVQGTPVPGRSSAGLTVLPAVPRNLHNHVVKNESPNEVGSPRIDQVFCNSTSFEHLKQSRATTSSITPGKQLTLTKVNQSGSIRPMAPPLNNQTASSRIPNPNVKTYGNSQLNRTGLKSVTFITNSGPIPTTSQTRQNLSTMERPTSSSPEIRTSVGLTNGNVMDVSGKINGLTRKIQTVKGESLDEKLLKQAAEDAEKSKYPDRTLKVGEEYMSCRLCRKAEFRRGYEETYRKHLFEKHLIDIGNKYPKATDDEDYDEDFDEYEGVWYKCNVCRILFQNDQKHYHNACKGTFTTIRLKIAGNENIILPCGLCQNQVFKSFGSLHQHLNIKHEMLGTKVYLNPFYRCMSCLETFEDTAILTRHSYTCQNIPSEETILKLAQAMVKCPDKECKPHVSIHDVNQCYKKLGIKNCLMCAHSKSVTGDFENHVTKFHCRRGNKKKYCEFCPDGRSLYEYPTVDTLFTHIIKFHYHPALEKIGRRPISLSTQFPDPDSRPPPLKKMKASSEERYQKVLSSKRPLIPKPNICVISNGNIINSSASSIVYPNAIASSGNSGLNTSGRITPKSGSTLTKLNNTGKIQGSMDIVINEVKSLASTTTNGNGVLNKSSKISPAMVNGSSINTSGRILTNPLIIGVKSLAPQNNSINTSGRIPVYNTRSATNTSGKIMMPPPPVQSSPSVPKIIEIRTLAGQLNLSGVIKPAPRPNINNSLNSTQPIRPAIPRNLRRVKCKMDGIDTIYEIEDNNGRVYVRDGNGNLRLLPHAKVNSNGQVEIFEIHRPMNQTSTIANSNVRAPTPTPNISRVQRTSTIQMNTTGNFSLQPIPKVTTGRVQSTPPSQGVNQHPGITPSSSSSSVPGLGPFINTVRNQGVNTSMKINPNRSGAQVGPRGLNALNISQTISPQQHSNSNASIDQIPHVINQLNKSGRILRTTVPVQNLNASGTIPIPILLDDPRYNPQSQLNTSGLNRSLLVKVNPSTTAKLNSTGGISFQQTNPVPVRFVKSLNTSQRIPSLGGNSSVVTPTKRQETFQSNEVILPVDINSIMNPKS